MARQESGPIKIGDDWPGYFMRGDDALSTAAALRAIADRLDDPAVQAGAMLFLKRLAGRLDGCHVAQKPDADAPVFDRYGYIRILERHLGREHYEQSRKTYEIDRAAVRENLFGPDGLFENMVDGTPVRTVDSLTPDEVRSLKRPDGPLVINRIQPHSDG